MTFKHNDFNKLFLRLTYLSVEEGADAGGGEGQLPSWPPAPVERMTGNVALILGFCFPSSARMSYLQAKRRVQRQRLMKIAALVEQCRGFIHLSLVHALLVAKAMPTSLQYCCTAAKNREMWEVSANYRA